MATNQVIPPLPKGFVLESEIPPLPKGFVLEDDSDIKVDTVKTKVEEPKKEKPDKVEPELRVAPKPTFGQIFVGARPNFCPLLLLQLQSSVWAAAPTAPTITTPLIKTTPTCYTERFFFFFISIGLSIFIQNKTY